MKKFFSLFLVVVLALSLVACGPKPVEEKAKTYTMHDFLASTTSLKWNPLTWETADDSSVLGYLSMGFYDYRVAVDANGKSLGKYEVVPEMAAALPEDVTAQYVGRFGVKEGESNKAFRIRLNQAATWQDGTKITADDYIYSMQQQLDPAQLNRRADSYYGGDFSFVNAQNYLYSGKKVYVKSSDYFAEYNAENDDKLVFQWGLDDAVFSYFSNWLNGYKSYLDSGAYGDTIVVFLNTAFGAGLTVTDEQVEALEGKTLAEIKADAAMNAVWEDLIGFWQTEPNEELHFFVTEKTYDTYTFDQVGLQKIDDYTIDIIIEKELENPNFYLPYHLSSTWLVKRDLYEACWKTNDDGSRMNTYGTSVETTASYGPYILTYFEADKQLKFAKNENWYGYKDEAHVVNGVRLYQTTNVQIDVISTHESQLLAFKKGEIDAVGLQAADLEEFGNSKYKMLTPQSYTTKLTFNTDLAKLQAREEAAGGNKGILTIQKFRHALALSFDRADFCTQFTAGHTAGFGLFNYMYQFFGSDGLSSSYRDTDAAKEALVRLYGLEYGAGKEYATLAEAYKAITGYDVTSARALLVEAIEEAIAAGVYTEGQDVKLEFSVYQGDEIYVNMFNFFDSAVKELAKGTKLEGKISLTMNVDEDYYDTMYDGKTDIIFSTWGGATYGTFGMMSNVYVDDYTGNGNQMEIGFDTSKVMVTYTLNSTIGEKTFSLKAWCDWLNNKDIDTGEDLSSLGTTSSVAPEDRAKLVAELEYTYLNSFVTTPVYYRQTVSLHSMKINYVADAYIDLVGFGGLSQITYNYDDDAWAAYVASQGGQLKY